MTRLFLKCCRPAPTDYDTGAFWEELEDLPREAVEAGMREAARDADQYLPTAGRVRREAIAALQAIESRDRERRLKLAPPPYRHPTPEEFEDIKQWRIRFRQGL